MNAVSDLKSKKRLLSLQKTNQFLKNQDRKKLSREAVKYFKLFDFEKLHQKETRKKTSKKPVIALYSPLKTEVRPEALRKMLPESSFVYPIDDGGFMEAPVSIKKPFKKSVRGFLQPEGGRKFSPRSIDLFIVPLLAFDRDLNRLGRGAGFYDRALSSAGKKALKTGLSWSIQVQNSPLPQERHDQALDAVLTESWALFSPRLLDLFEKKGGAYV